MVKFSDIPTTHSSDPSLWDDDSPIFECPSCGGDIAAGEHVKGCERAALFFHASPKPDACEHDFQGWQETKNDEGLVCGGTTVCTKCGMDAMSYSLRVGL
jgi:predicted RNA-binding Zn-ribbon protein involved in translation (DUF1610 family)